MILPLWYNPFKENRFKIDISYFTFSVYQLRGDLHSCGEKEYKSERTRAAFITLHQKPHTVTYILNYFIHSWILLRLICTTVLTFKCLAGQCENLDIIRFLKDSNLKKWKIWNAIFFYYLGALRSNLSNFKSTLYKSLLCKVSTFIDLIIKWTICCTDPLPS